MKFYWLLLLCFGIQTATKGQTGTTELYDLIKKIVPDSTGFENVGDWAIGNSKKYPVQWKEDKITMSDDADVNFYRLGTVNLTIRGNTFKHNGEPVNWNIMLKGPRMGYSNFSIISSPSKELSSRQTIDSIFQSKSYKAKLIKKCDAKDLTGFYYYLVTIPKKDPLYLKLTWITVNGATAMRIDCYDEWSSKSAKLDCPK
jgi:hypothetical protein